MSEVSDLDWRVVNDVLYLTETSRDGEYMDGDALFRSETNNVDVTFTSDSTERRTGFTLDIRSTLCSNLEHSEEDEEDEDTSVDCADRTAQEVVIAAGELLEGALVSDTENDGNYPDYACQNWNIMTDENQVYVMFKSKQPFNQHFCKFF